MLLNDDDALALFIPSTVFCTPAPPTSYLVGWSNGSSCVVASISQIVSESHQVTKLTLISIFTPSLSIFASLLFVLILSLSELDNLKSERIRCEWIQSVHNFCMGSSEWEGLFVSRPSPPWKNCDQPPHLQF